MREERLHFCAVEPILYKLKGFSFLSMAYDEMHTLEGMSKHLVEWCLARIQRENVQYRTIFARMDEEMDKAVGSGTPALRPLPKGFTSTTQFTFSEWKSAIVVFAPIICFICKGTDVERAVCTFLVWRKMVRRKNHTGRWKTELRKVNNTFGS